MKKIHRGFDKIILSNPLHPRKLSCQYCKKFFWLSAQQLRTLRSKIRKEYCPDCLVIFKRMRMKPFKPRAIFTPHERTILAVNAAMRGLRTFSSFRQQKPLDKMRKRRYKWGIRVWLPDGPAHRTGGDPTEVFMNTSLFTKTETVEVSTKVDEDLYATSKDIPVPANHAEFAAAAGEDGVFELALREYLRQQKYELGQKLKDAVAPKDEQPSTRRANAKFIEV